MGVFGDYRRGSSTVPSAVPGTQYMHHKCAVLFETRAHAHVEDWGVLFWGGPPYLH